MKKEDQGLLPDSVKLLALGLSPGIELRALSSSPVL